MPIVLRASDSNYPSCAASVYLIGIIEFVCNLHIPADTTILGWKELLVCVHFVLDEETIQIRISHYVIPIGDLGLEIHCWC